MYDIAIAKRCLGRSRAKLTKTMNRELESIECPECKSTRINKNGHKAGKQNHICVDCGRQFIDSYQSYQGYAQEVKKECLKMYVNGMDLRGIERVKGVDRTSIINWVKQVGELLPDAYDPEIIPEVGELDELETFVGSKKAGASFGGFLRMTHTRHKIWLWTAVNHFQPGILGWVMGDHSAETFRPLWELVGHWQCYFYVTDGWPVYPIFIPDGDQIG
jgi:insertion element IS1 protein InsB